MLLDDHGKPSALSEDCFWLRRAAFCQHVTLLKMHGSFGALHIATEACCDCSALCQMVLLLALLDADPRASLMFPACLFVLSQLLKVLNLEQI